MIYYTLDDQHIVRLFEQGLQHVEESNRVTGPKSRAAEARASSGRKRH
jgi:hypothetical protein